MYNMERAMAENCGMVEAPGLGYACIKRGFDVVAALLGLVLFSPLFLTLALLVWAEDRGPVLFGHTRVGRGGRPINIYKFRSMKVGADDLEKSLTPEQLERYHREFKLAGDPRITKIGAFLRRSSLDELPQLWNVLRGEMSIVGPRPILKDELEENYTEAQQRRLLSIRPGLTGYWQAYARNGALYSTGERQRMEMYYVDHASVWLDVKILFKTVWRVFKGDGV
jgi:lipopolysaccharide/colanic/teichoic acid biosynthesis glycosyltransferase